MNGHYKLDPWKIIEEGFDPAYQKAAESIFSLGNGKMGQRANFEEDYSGETLQGSYVGGVYYPDKTRVGWWKNGYPEYFAKVLNAPNWIGIKVEVNGQNLDLAKVSVSDFVRELNMKEGYLKRSFVAEFENGNIIQVEALRFCSFAHDEIGAIRYSVKPLNFSGTLTFTPYVDADVENEDSNYDEKFWENFSVQAEGSKGVVTAQTKKSGFVVATAMESAIFEDGNPLSVDTQIKKTEKKVLCRYNLEAKEGKNYSVVKVGSYISSFSHPKEEVANIALQEVANALALGFDVLLKEQVLAWSKRWEFGDISIEGDVAAQQAIRFNIFQLHQTYTGEDERLNIGPKGFTGEKYGGSTYWDTEAYCFQFYLSTAGERVAKNLLQYRHNHLQKAIENAQKLGFTDGAALYPMVTMNGEECHNEWEITFEEIHRNGAIAYAIYNYENYTGKTDYVFDQGLDVLVGISRFWAQRVNWSEDKKKYVMLGVTGPNEYENNVNNNWYTNYIATWTLRYTLSSLQNLKSSNADQYAAKLQQLSVSEEEMTQWQKVIDNMYYPTTENGQILLQQDGFLDKEIIPAKDLNPSNRPLNQKWSWDRILRSCYIKQGDVLQGLYFFEHEFDKAQIERNFDFYEPITVHESSLSPCIHSVTAAYLNRMDKAYELYLRTARLDLDDYNKEVHEGLHITSMAGTWKSIVEGFGGMRVKEGALSLNPVIPEKWESYSFNILFRGHSLGVNTQKSGVTIVNHSAEGITFMLKGQTVSLCPNETKTF